MLAIRHTGRMAQPGWYPDPSGSGAPRYWDGRGWSSHPGVDVSSHGSGANGGGSHSSIFIGISIGLLAIVLVVAVLIWQPWNSSAWLTQGDTNSAKPTGSQWNELEPTETPSSPQPTDDQGRPMACPLVDVPDGTVRGGRYISGDFAFQGVPGWPEEGGGQTIDFASKRSGQAEFVNSEWIAVTAIGQLSTTDFSPDPRTAALQVSDCLSSSYFYDVLDFRERLQDERFITSDGMEGWLIRENYWNVPNKPVTGDEVVIVVLEAGGGNALTLFHSQAPIEDQKRKDLVAEALGTLAQR